MTTGKHHRGQTSLEYLMTYGWALILIAAVIGVLVFIVSSPASEVTFSSSDPTKIMIKAGTADGSTAEVQIQNITGGNIEVTSINSGEFSNCTLDGWGAPVSITAGAPVLLECDAPSDNTGAITIDYTDFAGLERTAVIRIAGSTGGSQAQLCESGGTGTVGDPLMVTTLAELDNVRNAPALYYEMCQNIDASGTSLWNEDLPGNPGTYFGFEPIPNFTGSFDGKGYSITNLYINRPLENNIGLFSVSTGGTISNLGVLNVDITGNNSVGALAGVIVVGTTIADSYSSGTVSSVGSDDVGGLVGMAANSAGQISDSYSTASVSGIASVGGLVGRAIFGTIDRSYSTGNVSGTNSVAGLVGNVTITLIYDSYATGSVTGTGWVGGLVGYKEDDAQIHRSYSTGAVSGSNDVGGLVGEEDSVSTNVHDSFWDTETSGQAVSDGGTGKTTAEMMQQNTFDPPWDFATIWDIDEGINYPFLR